jgi:hypothetical protein
VRPRTRRALQGEAGGGAPYPPSCAHRGVRARGERPGLRPAFGTRTINLGADFVSRALERRAARQRAGAQPRARCRPAFARPATAGGPLPAARSPAARFFQHLRAAPCRNVSKGITRPGTALPGGPIPTEWLLHERPGGVWQPGAAAPSCGRAGGGARPLLFAVLCRWAEARGACRGGDAFVRRARGAQAGGRSSRARACWMGGRGQAGTQRAGQPVGGGGGGSIGPAGRRAGGGIKQWPRWAPVGAEQGQAARGRGGEQLQLPLLLSAVRTPSGGRRADGQ